MLLNNATLDGIIIGKISVVFRVWKKPTVKTGGSLMTRKGVISIIEVRSMDPSEVTDADLANAGLSSRDDFCKTDREGTFYLIRVAFQGEDPRLSLRRNVDPKELEKIYRKLIKMGGWTFQYLKIIGRQPNVHAQILADSVGLDKPAFKARVRKLKALGLTESLRPGYRLSPRGEKIVMEYPDEER